MRTEPVSREPMWLSFATYRCSCLICAYYKYSSQGRRTCQYHGGSEEDRAQACLQESCVISAILLNYLVLMQRQCFTWVNRIFGIREKRATTKVPGRRAKGFSYRPNAARGAANTGTCRELQSAPKHRGQKETSDTARYAWLPRKFGLAFGLAAGWRRLTCKALPVFADCPIPILARLSWPDFANFFLTVCTRMQRTWFHID